MKCKEIIAIMEKLAPKDLAESWDNVGLQIGNMEDDINRILLTLDVTDKVVDEAIEKNIDLIISHHPLIFKAINSITMSDYKGKMISKLIKNDINLYVSHTNMDIADGGLNDMLAKKLKLNNLKVLSPSEIEIKGKLSGLGRVGEYEDYIYFEDFTDNIKDILNIDTLRVAGIKKDKIKKIGLCSGSGADYMIDAARAGVDVYITGDVKYHEAQMAEELDIILIDAGHFSTEIIFMEGLKEYLDRELAIMFR